MSEIRDLSETEETEVKVRFAGGSHRKDRNSREHSLRLTMKFPDGTTRTEAKAVLGELIGKELAVDMGGADE